MLCGHPKRRDMVSGMDCSALMDMEHAVGAKRYRYWLHRDLAAQGDEGLVFVMLNPSTANATEDDRTVRRCMDFGRRWGFRELTVVNLFALRATDAAELRRHGAEAIGERNDEMLRWLRQHPATTCMVAAWGNYGTHLGRDAAVLPVIQPAMALQVTQKGCPYHPLYVRKSALLSPYAAPAEEPIAAGRRADPATPIPVRRALAKLGGDIRDARRRRRITVALLAERASVSRATLANIEKGDAGTAIGNYARVLFSLGLNDRLAELADSRHDETGLALDSERLPQRVRHRRSWR